MLTEQHHRYGRNAGCVRLLLHTNLVRHAFLRDPAYSSMHSVYALRCMVSRCQPVIAVSITELTRLHSDHWWALRTLLNNEAGQGCNIW
jgi:hypothetical protein